MSVSLRPDHLIQYRNEEWKKCIGAYTSFLEAMASLATAVTFVAAFETAVLTTIIINVSSAKSNLVGFRIPFRYSETMSTSSQPFWLGYVRENSILGEDY